jgi:riboflavin synthase alpha subunit
MNLGLSAVLSLVQKWQNAATEMHGTMMIETREWVIDSKGRVILEGDSLTLTNGNGCEFRIALMPTMTFSYAGGMLKIEGTGWRCNLYESKDKSFVRVV